MKKPIKDRTLVVVDRDKLAKEIQKLCHYELKHCYEAISACEIGDPWCPDSVKHGQVNQKENLGCDWVDAECFVNPHRCSLAKVGICQIYALYGAGEHGQVKSGERASG